MPYMSNYHLSSGSYGDLSPYLKDPVAASPKSSKFLKFSVDEDDGVSIHEFSGKGSFYLSLVKDCIGGFFFGFSKIRAWRRAKVEDSKVRAWIQSQNERIQKSVALKYFPANASVVVQESVERGNFSYYNEKDPVTSALISLYANFCSAEEFTALLKQLPSSVLISSFSLKKEGDLYELKLPLPVLQRISVAHPTFAVFDAKKSCIQLTFQQLALLLGGIGFLHQSEDKFSTALDQQSSQVASVESEMSSVANSKPTEIIPVSSVLEATRDPKMDQSSTTSLQKPDSLIKEKDSDSSVIPIEISPEPVSLGSVLKSEIPLSVCSFSSDEVPETVRSADALPKGTRKIFTVSISDSTESLSQGSFTEAASQQSVPVTDASSVRNKEVLPVSQISEIPKEDSDSSAELTPPPPQSEASPPSSEAVQTKAEPPQLVPNVDYFAKMEEKPRAEVERWTKLCGGDPTMGTKCFSLDHTAKTTLEQLCEEHKTSKVFLSENVAKCGGSFYIIQPPEDKFKACKADPDKVKETDFSTNPLSKDVFSKGVTGGTGQDIFADGKGVRLTGRPEATKVTVVCSQYNCSEACRKDSPTEPGKAVGTYQWDRTQGPDSQMAYPTALIELINIGAQKGFNALVQVLSLKTKHLVQHGYFEPDKANAKVCIDDLKSKGFLAEFAMIGCVPTSGKKPVYECLMAAPNMEQGRYMPIGPERDQIEYLCALINFLSIFAGCIQLAKEKGAPVDLDLAGIGLGAFGNAEKNYAKALYIAGKVFEDELRENKVNVTFREYGASSDTEATLDRFPLLKKLYDSMK